MIEFYSRADRFGEYPFVEEKYGNVAVYPFSFGGMEHQTMTTVHRQWVTYGSESGFAHELAHMWYGDNVTCHDWREIWLNEGGASYLDPLWMHHYYGHQRFLDDMDDYAGYFFDADQRDRHPIYNPGLNRLFEYGHTYCKAAWVNHMLRYVEADTVFDTPGIWWSTERAWLDSFAYGTATTEDRKRIHEDLTGLELDWFFDEWVFDGGFPNYTVNWFNRETTDGWQLVVDVGQSNGSGAPACFHMPVELRATVNGTDTLLRWDIAANPQRNVFTMPGQVTSIVFDPGNWILHKERITSGIENELKPGVGVSLPTLHRVPSPSAGAVSISYSLPHASDVDLSVLDAAGRQIRTLDSGRRAGDRHTLRWNRADDSGREVAAGLYFIRLRAGDRAETRKLVLR
jgi:aminopeptidase N